MDYLYKKDALFELYPLEEGDDYFSIRITHKTEGGNFYGKWLEFRPDLEELHITDVGGGDDWICGDEDDDCEPITREELKIRLENKGFSVKMM